MKKVGNLRGEKIKYEDGVGCCVWYPLKDDNGDEGVGICFDFTAEDIVDFIELLKQLRDSAPEEYK